MNHKEEVFTLKQIDYFHYYLNCIIIPGIVMYRSGRTPLPARLVKIAE